MSLPQHKEGHDFQCPIDCRWFTMVGFLGHFEMKHEGRNAMSKRMRDELIKRGDHPEFWRQFWAHCALRPDEYHPAYVRVDYGEPQLDVGEDMEDGEIPEPPNAQKQLQQHVHQPNGCVPPTPAGVFGVKAP
ncbi:hypothetical protein FOMPIDRAFT_162728 [Fomitopsis schrenkii]|uniref:Uncharacterized protein n=1 Tax=Fomitopsis schrenkii TaxID=2126942 RepID=S8FLI3_FOMSC|nr:hypothetical protein FOMPIDRAFT_162728 [Fomitopsis schrenkii]